MGRYFLFSLLLLVSFVGNGSSSNRSCSIASLVDVQENGASDHPVVGLRTGNQEEYVIANLWAYGTPNGFLKSREQDNITHRAAYQAGFIASRSTPGKGDVWMLQEVSTPHLTAIDAVLPPHLSRSRPYFVQGNFSNLTLWDHTIYDYVGEIPNIGALGGFSINNCYQATRILPIILQNKMTHQRTAFLNVHLTFGYHTPGLDSAISQTVDSLKFQGLDVVIGGDFNQDIGGFLTSIPNAEVYPSPSPSWTGDYNNKNNNRRYNPKINDGFIVSLSSNSFNPVSPEIGYDQNFPRSPRNNLVVSPQPQVQPLSFDKLDWSEYYEKLYAWFDNDDTGIKKFMDFVSLKKIENPDYFLQILTKTNVKNLDALALFLQGGNQTHLYDSVCLVRDWLDWDEKKIEDFLYVSEKLNIEYELMLAVLKASNIKDMEIFFKKS